MRRRDGGDGDGDGDGGCGGGLRELAVAADDGNPAVVSRELATTVDPRSIPEDVPWLLLDDCPAWLTALRYRAILCMMVSDSEPFPDPLAWSLS